jgi:hypothetical protein
MAPSYYCTEGQSHDKTLFDREADRGVADRVSACLMPPEGFDRDSKSERHRAA